MAGNPANLASVQDDPRYRFLRGDICDRELLARLFAEHRPRALLNFAAESHVDRSLHGADDFVRTNVVGTFSLLEEARATGIPWPRRPGTVSASCMSRPTRSTARSLPGIPRLPKRRHTPRTAPTRPRKRPPTTSSGPATTATACRR